MNTKKTSKGRPLNIPQATLDFLMIITEPKKLSHKADHSDFIKNAVLSDLRNTILECDRRGSY